MKNLDELTDYIASVSKDQGEVLKIESTKPKRKPKSKTISTPYRFPLVEVIWDDAETSDGWEEPTSDLKPAIATTVGFLVRETDKHLLIASTYDPNHTNGRIQIPIGMVVSRKVLM